MTGPVEVVLVDRKQPKPWVSLARKLLIGLPIIGLLAGLFLMLLLPLAHETLGTPDLHPGYWRCVGVMLLARAVVHLLVHELRPTASQVSP